MAVLGIFNLKIINPERLLFEGEVSNIFLRGDTGEFEILSYHYPILSLLIRGEIIIDWRFTLPIKKGVVRFFKTDCVIMAEV